MATRFLEDLPEEKVSMVAVCFKGSRVISYGYNETKTHPRMKEIADSYNIKKMYPDSENMYVSYNSHAELNAVNSANSEIDTIVILRKTKNNKLADAKPCNVCRKLLEEEGIENIYYSKDNCLHRLHQ